MSTERRAARRSARAIEESARTVEAYAQNLESSEARFRDVAEASSDWLWEIDARMRLTYLSARFTEVTGIAAAVVLGKNLSHFFLCDGALDGWAEPRGDAEAPGAFRDIRCRYHDAAGGIRVCRLAGRPILGSDGSFQGYRGTAADVTAEVEAHARANHLALHDPLTELPNRVLLRERLDLALAAADAAHPRDCRGRGLFWRAGKIGRMSHSVQLAERLNADCQCVSLDSARLEAELERVSPGFHGEVMEGRPHLFSSSVAFVGAEHVTRMARLVAAVERVVALPAYRKHVLGWAADSARHATPARGVFLGYDFHLGAAGPQLIEINTNAGGGLLNAVLARAQKACCDDVETLLPGDLGADTPEHLFLDMFRAEWRAFADAAGNCAPLRSVAIVDEAPRTQYLYPEFVLFQRLFEQAGIRAVICDPGELAFRDGALWHGGLRIDLVYNRLTDFHLDDPAHAALRSDLSADLWDHQPVQQTPLRRIEAPVRLDERRVRLETNAGPEFQLVDALRNALGRRIGRQVVAMLIEIARHRDGLDGGRHQLVWALEVVVLQRRLIDLSRESRLILGVGLGRIEMLRAVGKGRVQDIAPCVGARIRIVPCLPASGHGNDDSKAGADFLHGKQFSKCPPRRLTYPP